ncbi:GatB/YqeY domain-containing protein [Candidatus Gottesmanbacteria bacterium]|nr:GatB/YqeY domain-containing protein [Candidatus Gottesmanbacteria bacterium]
MLLDGLRQDLTASMKKGDSVRVDTLRFLLAAIRNSAIAKYDAAGESKMTDADVLDVIKKQAKTHRESIDAFTKGNRPDLVEKEQKELAILEVFLPKQISDEELKALLAQVVASRETNFGLLMKQAMTAVGGKADGGRVSSILRQMTQNK